MRHWVFHPLIFYPLALLIASAVILFSFDPLSWRSGPTMQAGRIEQGAIILEGGAFDAPASSPEQVVQVRREGFGRAAALRIAVRPNQPPPAPSETGARVLLTPESAALIENRPVEMRLAYVSLPTNAAAGLAVSLQGARPADWVATDLPVGEGELSFALPAQSAVSAIGLRAIGGNDPFNSGVEILRIELRPM